MLHWRFERPPCITKMGGGGPSGASKKGAWQLITFLHFKCVLVLLSRADVKMEIPVLVQSLKSSILHSTSFQFGESFWGVGSAAVEQSRRKAYMVAQVDKADPRIPPNKTKSIIILYSYSIEKLMVPGQIGLRTVLAL